MPVLAADGWSSPVRSRDFGITVFLRCLAVSSRTSIRTRWVLGTRCLLVSDTDEAALLSNLRPWLSGPAQQRSRRDASYPSDSGL